jgi:long-chain-acyl-CoA dehydrogenase
VKRTLYDTDQVEFASSVQEFINSVIAPRHDTIIEQKLIDRDIWIEAGKLGFLGLGIPERFGGGEANDFRFNSILTEKLSSVSAALPSAFGIHTDIVAPYLVELTSEAQKERWLPKFCSGELITAIAMSEPTAGSDLAGIRTVAKRDGSNWIINGSKIFITNGTSADLIICAAKTSPNRGAKGITLFALEVPAEGFTRGRKLDKVGQPESDTAELFFDDLIVSDENVIGQVDRGFFHMMDMLPQERLNAAIANLAHARAIFDETVVYAGQRKAFGSAIGSFQYNKFTLAEVDTALQVTQAFVDQSILAHNQRALTATDAARAKWWTADVQNKALDSCVQIFGGYGYMNEYRVARAWKDARVTRIWAGSNEIMKELIGRELGF